jgi:hypothetical protein
MDEGLEFLSGLCLSRRTNYRFVFFAFFREDRVPVVLGPP